MEYRRPLSLGEAAKALAEPDARGLAGGTDLLVHLGREESWPAELVDLKVLPDLRGIERRDGLLRIGAATTIVDILKSPKLAPFPALKEACRLFAARAIRNRATLGGNLVNASPAADTVPPMMVHEAVCVTDRRRIPVADFTRGPGETILARGEILVALELPVFPERSREFFIKLAPRDAMAIAVVNLAGLVVLREGKVALARIALGAVAPTAIRAGDAEAFLEGKTLTKETVAEAAKLAARATSPIDDIRASADYRRRMIARLLDWELLKLVGESSI